jgi:site-specific recombinase XerD
MTRYQFSSILSRSLNLAGIDSRHFKSHSFRIGAATTLAQQGLSADVIQSAGRWRSLAYQFYIR